MMPTGRWRPRWLASGWGAAMAGVLGVCALACQAVNAGIDQGHWAPQIRRVTASDGLPTHTLYSVAQDPSGYLWFGSEAGIVRHDGVRFRLFDSRSESGPRPSSDSASLVYVDRDGDLWIGTWGGGLNRIRQGSSEVEVWQFDPQDPNSLASDYVQAIHQDRHGILWIGSGAGLMRMDLASGRMQRVEVEQPGALSLSLMRVWSIADDSKGRVWFGTTQGLFRHDPVQGRSEHIALKRGEGGGHTDEVRLVVVDGKDRVWVGLQTGFAGYDPQSNTLTPIEAQHPQHRIPLIVNTALPAGDDHLWLGTWSGVWLLDCERAALVEVGTGNGMQWFPADDVRGLHRERSGQLWAATRYNGAISVDLHAPKFRLYRDELANPDSRYASTLVRAVYRHGDEVWLHTDGAMLRADLQNGQFHPVMDSVGLRVGRDGPSAFLDNGDAWLPTTFGAARYDRGRQRVTLNDRAAALPGLRDRNFGYVVRDRSRRLWWATQREGVLVTDEDGKVLRHLPPGQGHPGELADAAPTCIVEDRSGAKWLCSFRGLTRISPDGRDLLTYRHDFADSSTLSHDRVNAILEDQAGRLWLGTQAGLDRWDPQRSRFIRHRPAEGAIAIDALVESDAGTLWIASKGQLRQFNAHIGEFVGPPLNTSVSFFPRAALRLDAQRLLFGTNQGLLMFDPRRADNLGFVPPLAITGAWVDRREVELRDDRPLQLPAGTEILELQFAAFDFRSPGNNRYHYRLKGFDSDWVDAGNQTSVTYTNLRPGDYAFEIRAAGPDQRWNQLAQPLAIRVEPPWWGDWRFQLAVVAAFGLLVAGFMRAYAARVRRRELELEAQVASRTTKIAEQARDLQATLAHLQATQERVVMQEKMASLGTLTAGVAHEINNPTNFAHAGAQNLRNELKQFEHTLRTLAGSDVEPEVSALFDQRFAALHEQLDTISEGAERIRSIVGDLRRFSRLDEAARNTVSVDDGLKSTLALVRTQYGDAVRFELDLRADRPIDCWPAQLNQVFMNLVVNACQAIVSRYGRKPLLGELQIHSRNTGNGVLIDFIDNGVGIAAEHVSRVFEPFFTTKGVGEGTGMGMAIAYGIVQRHGGRIDIESQLGQGTRIQLYLPSRAVSASA